MLFRPSPIVCAKKPSSTLWLARQARDPYVRLRSSPHPSAGGVAYRSRSAFKLLEMNDKWAMRFLDYPDVRVVLDLGSAPGGWSQVAARKLGWDPQPARMREAKTPYPRADGSDGDRGTGSWSARARPPSRDDDLPANANPVDISDLENHAGGTGGMGLGRGTIIAVDLLRMTPIPGVQFIQADFLAPDTEELIRSIIAHRTGDGDDAKADVVLCDMAANLTGTHYHDMEASLTICTSVLEFCKRHMRSAESIGRQLGGVLLMKHFVHPALHVFRTEILATRFTDVRFLKPHASRPESNEGYFICRGWKS
ncbi:ribosomal RNA large subunit methyltransferase J [Mycena pura]|uniref:rRNA methyltransferase 2, mitochondrial n=1 Tax=Mycena pura TaxID=153505 RepID=A0AAD6VBB9_9AGAR|nr:ribosomal RNA large subunit methyltransferase J [Mycena pura]